MVCIYPGCTHAPIISETLEAMHRAIQNALLEKTMCFPDFTLNTHLKKKKKKLSNQPQGKRENSLIFAQFGGEHLRICEPLKCKDC